MHEPDAVWLDAPRHAPGMPFPAYRFVPGLHPHPRRDPAGSLFESPEPQPGLAAEHWAGDATYLHGVDLYHQGYLWEAHEAWEACFQVSDEPSHRALLQALIQLGAAMLQAHRGVENGVRLLVPRLLGRLDDAAAPLAPGDRVAGIDPRALAADVERHFAGVTAGDSPLRRSGPGPRLLVA